MRIPFNWLKEFVDIKLSAQEVADAVTMAGLETTVIDTAHDGEPILEVDILPNRGDCNSVLGTAREIVAVVNSKLKIQNPKLLESKKKASSVLAVEVKDQKLCPRYMARVIENITVKESPEWLKKKLIAAGARPINNIVDVTNYILLGFGQPMHAFDFYQIHGGKIIVRRAAAQETVKTLDNESRKLDHDALVIADSAKTIAIAGIMGAANTEVSSSTKTIVLESAFFEPIGISKTSKSLKLRTESSVRFEKTVDWNMVEYALDHAAALIADLSGGTILSGKIDKKAKAKKPALISLRFEKVNSLLGFDISSKNSVKILKQLGFKLTKQTLKSVSVEVPSWRVADIEREVDLIEEIARIFGYHKVPETNPRIRRSDVAITLTSEVSRIKDILVGAGLYEVQTYSFVDPKDAFDDSLKVTNPMSISESVMRTSMLPSILNVVSHNIRHQVDEVKIFEVGKVFKRKGAESLVLSGAITHTKADFFELKGVIETLISEFNYKFHTENIVSDWYNPSKSAAILIHGKPIAMFGLLHPEAAKKYDLSRDLYIFEIDIESLIAQKVTKGYKALPKYPKVDRDIAMFVPENVSYNQIITLIKETAGDLLEEVKLFDQYKNSQAYRLSFRDVHATLTDEIVNERFMTVIKALEEKLGVTIRKS